MPRRQGVLEPVEEFDDIPSEFKCPFSGCLMREPLENKKCIHHLDKDSLEIYLRSSHNGTKDCPIPGCKGKWKIQTAKLDLSLKRRIESFIADRRRRKVAVVDLTFGDSEDDDSELEVPIREPARPMLADNELLVSTFFELGSPIDLFLLSYCAFGFEIFGLRAPFLQEAFLALGLRFVYVYCYPVATSKALKPELFMNAVFVATQRIFGVLMRLIPMVLKLFDPVNLLIVVLCLLLQLMLGWRVSWLFHAALAILLQWSDFHVMVVKWVSQ